MLNGIAVGQEQQEPVPAIPTVISQDRSATGRHALVLPIHATRPTTRPQPTRENGVAVIQEIQDARTRDTDGNIAGRSGNCRYAVVSTAYATRPVSVHEHSRYENGVAVNQEIQDVCTCDIDGTSASG